MFSLMILVRFPLLWDDGWMEKALGGGALCFVTQHRLTLFYSFGAWTGDP